MNLPPKVKPSKQRRTIVFVTFESEFAKSGGLGTVMQALPKHAAQYEKCFVLAPYFRQITREENIIKQGGLVTNNIVSPFNISIGNTQYAVEVTQIADPNGFQTYLISSEEGFFTAEVDPYINPRYPAQPMHPNKNPLLSDKLTEDALFFCAAVPGTLVKLAEAGLISSEDLVLHLQDWETACVAQAIRKEAKLRSVACVLTLHNPYDRYLADASSSLVSALISHLGLRRDNVLAQMIPLVDGPLSTVSQNFADELTGDPLHTYIFTSHLQGLLVSKGLVGIDNGLFGRLAFPFSQEACRGAKQGDFEKMQQEKWERREKLGEVMARYQRELTQKPGAEKKTWGEDLDLSDPHVPVFLVIGRDDPRQKGFDVVAEAIRMIPKGRARYIFTPMPGTEGMLGLGFLKKLAQDRPGEVKVFPFRLDEEPFHALERGSSFMIMSSLYEPFGAANSAYLAGMPVVARATGGLVQQVIPYPSASLSRHGRQLVALFHSHGSAPTGFLFREPSVPDEVEGWWKIINCAYWDQSPRGDRIEDRRGTPLFEATVQSAAWAIQHAIDLYTSNQAEYAKMIYNGFKMLDKFSWERAVRDYQRIYDRVCD